MKSAEPGERSEVPAWMSPGLRIGTAETAEVVKRKPRRARVARRVSLWREKTIILRNKILGCFGG